MVSVFSVFNYRSIKHDYITVFEFLEVRVRQSAAGVKIKKYTNSQQAVGRLVLVLFVRLFGLCLFRFVGFLFLLGSGKACGL